MPRCPKCRSATDLIKYEGVSIHNCGVCGGHWLNDLKFDRILNTREVVMPEAVQQKMIAMADAANSQERLFCWTCGKQMVKESFKHWPEIQLDRCPGCNGLWLDQGELEKCQIYWEHMQDNPDSETAQRAARLGELDAQWAQRKADIEEEIEQAVNARNDGLLDVLWDIFRRQQ